MNRKDFLYVSVNGDDSNPGTEDKPFQSLERAQQVVRLKNKSTGLTVFIREGTYYLNKTMRFSPDDSGSDNYPVIWRAYPGEKPRISGNPAETSQRSLLQ